MAYFVCDEDDACHV